jgi:hypothetical protein
MKLQILKGSDKGKLFETKGDSLSIGNSEESDIQISGESVGKSHAIMRRGSNDSWVIEDLIELCTSNVPITKPRAQAGQTK